MNNLLKRTLSFALALIMVLSLAPVAGISVHATEAEEPVVTEPAESVTEVEPPVEETTEPPTEEPKAEELAEDAPQEESTEIDELEIIEVTVKDTPAMAYETTENVLVGTLPNGLAAKWRYDSNSSGGEASWAIGEGFTIIGTAKGGTMVKTNTSILTLTNNLDSEATLKFSYKLEPQNTSSAKWGTVSGLISVSSETEKKGTSETVIGSKESVTISFKSPDHGNTNILTLSDISLTSTVAADPTVTFKVVEGGSYTVDGTTVVAETPKTAVAGTDYQLIATPAEGYQFFGWYNETSEGYWSYSAEQRFTASEDAVIKPLFIPAATAIFSVGSARFYDLTEAGAAAAAGTEKTIILLNDGTVTGSHTIPAGTTLLIPHKDDQKEAYGAPPENATELANCVDAGQNTGYAVLTAWVTPSKYRELTLAEGATITVNGEIEVSGQHTAAGGGTGKNGGSPTGPLGYIKMEENSNITLNSGAILLCWGYIYGDGTVTAKSGSAVYENFQIMDFRGGSETLALATSMLVFPLSQYYVQNVEVAIKYEYGSTEYVTTSLFAQSTCLGTAVKFIGDGAMFQFAESDNDAYIIKKYDPVEDELCLEAYGDCVLAPISLEMNGSNINSESFALPITNNINISIKSGNATLKQSVMLLPGSSLTVDKDAILTIEDKYELQVFDSDSWTSGLEYNIETEEVAGIGTDLNFCHPEKKFSPIEYSPTKEKTRTLADLTDVTVDINGTIVTNGFMYSTMALQLDEEGNPMITGGANIISSQQTGSLVMNNGAGGADGEVSTYLFDQSKASFYRIPMLSAQLRNGDGTMLDTTGAEAGATFNYCKVCDAWHAGDVCDPTTVVTVTWANLGYTQDMAQDVTIGTVPTYPGETPTKAASGNTVYTFAGWKDKDGKEYPIGTALPAVTGDTVYYAYFTEVTNVAVTAKGNITYSVSGQKVTVTHSAACKVGYWDATNSKYVVIAAEANSDGSYTFTAPADITEVLLVMKGDVTGDGKYGLADTRAIAKSRLKPEHKNYAALEENWQIFAADVTSDGKYSLADTRAIAKSRLKTEHANYAPLTW